MAPAVAPAAALAPAPAPAPAPDPDPVPAPAPDFYPRPHNDARVGLIPAILKSLDREYIVWSVAQATIEWLQELPLDTKQRLLANPLITFRSLEQDLYLADLLRGDDATTVAVQVANNWHESLPNDIQ